MLAFFLALMLNRKMRAIGLFRFAYFYPVLMPLIGAASIFAFIYADNIGLVNIVIQFVRRADAHLDRRCVLDAYRHYDRRHLEANRLLYDHLPGGAANASQDVYEAADLDGASLLEQDPVGSRCRLLSGTTMFVLISAATNSFQMVDQLYALGEGVPVDRSNLLLYYHLPEVQRAHMGMSTR